MKTHIKFTLAMVFLVLMFSSLSRAELIIESVYPNVGKVDVDLSVTIRGGGFDENTRVSIIPDYGNRGRIVGSVDTPDFASRVAVLGQTAYVADKNGGLQIVDVSDPQNPVIVGSLGSANWTNGVAVSGQTAYVADGNAGLRVVDVSDPTNPAIVASVSMPEFAYGVEVLDQTAYVADGFGGLFVLDVSDPRNPVIVGSLPSPYFSSEDIAVLGRTAYMKDDEVGIIVIDVSDKSNPLMVGSIDYAGHAEGVTASGEAVYVTGDAGLAIVQVPHEFYPIQVIGPSELRMTLPSRSIAGQYNISVFNQEESRELVGAVSFLNPDDYQAQLEKKAIVAAGGTGDPSDRLVVPVRNCANLAYLSLMSQGYSRETIRFLAPHTDWDVDGDGLLNDVDDVCTTATLSSARCFPSLQPAQGDDGRGRRSRRGRRCLRPPERRLRRRPRALLRYGPTGPWGNGTERFPDKNRARRLLRGFDRVKRLPIHIVGRLRQRL